MDPRFVPNQSHDQAITVTRRESGSRDTVAAVVRWALWQCRDERGKRLRDARLRRRREAGAIFVSTQVWREAA